ncbi:type II toxin-antitoxin system VapC family toxin [Candidatus Woesearchaeota archaeon]|nr:type II toxin-antitoxin system VapC family toxin [Candidatus Woesearchaeota archaeon]
MGQAIEALIIDSWAWIEYFKGSAFGKKAKEYIESGKEILVSAINVSEIYRFLLRWCKSDTEVEKYINFVLKTAFVIPVDVNIAIKAAKLKHEKKFGLADAIVLVTAREHNGVVVSGDDDFEKEGDVIFIGGLK